MDQTMTPLVSSDDLAAALGRADLRILDIRSESPGSGGEGGRAAFEAGHIPGSVHTDYVADGWRMARDGAPGLLPEAEMLSRLFGRLGLVPESRVVIVPAGLSSGDFSAAARVYWTLRMAGHRDLAILDGGFAGWAAEGRPVKTGPGPVPAVTDYSVRLDAGPRATLGDVERAVAAGQGGATLIDTRGPKSFVGEEKSAQAKRAGRLPGAVNLESAGAFDPATHRLRPPAELAQLAASLPEGPSVTYCNTGQLAAAGWFVLSEMLGRPDVAMYDGSMSQWTQDPDRPVATGPADESR